MACKQCFYMKFLPGFVAIPQNLRGLIAMLYPVSTDERTTSEGTLEIPRWLRPVAY